MIGRASQIFDENSGQIMWKWVELTEKETKEVMDKVNEENNKLLEHCMRIGKSVVSEHFGNADKHDLVTKIATSLFNKLAHQSFSLLKNAVDKKIFKLKNEVKG